MSSYSELENGLRMSQEALDRLGGVGDGVSHSLAGCPFWTSRSESGIEALAVGSPSRGPLPPGRQAVSLIWIGKSCSWHWCPLKCY